MWCPRLAVGRANFFFWFKKNLSNMKEKIITKNKLTKKEIKRTIFEHIRIIKQININWIKGKS